jgi:replication initiation and membrane attachment protein
MNDLKVVTLLYQPLIGAKAYSLYMTLFGEVFEGESTHHSLMNHSQMNLQNIFEERKKLEAIGLLKTYRKNEGDDRTFLYELLPVLTPEDFFQDDVLSVYLYGRLGKDRYLEVKKRICLKQDVQSDGFDEVTSSFNDVFHSLHQSEIRAGLDSEVHQTTATNGDRKRPTMKDSVPQFSHEDFDFDTLVKDLSSFIIPADVLNDAMKEAIHRLAFIYHISPLEMSSIVQQAYFRDDELTPTSLRHEVQRWYKIEKPGQLPKLSERTQRVESKSESRQERTPEEMMIETFETISPRALLERYSEGGRAASADLRLIDTIMFDQKLPVGVINVLIDYVLNTNDMKLVHSHVEKIASQWKRKKISTVREAMALAKTEHQNYQAYKQKKTTNQTSRTYSRQQVRKDKLPEWMNEQPKKKNANTVDGKESVTASDEKWMEEYLKGL